jgi:Kef-type K+ transport system membrane component KefB
MAIILGIAALLGVVGTALRQPLIVAFIAVGVLVGPAGLDLTGDIDELELLASVGIAVLLFVVGLKLDLGVIRTMGRVALLTGLGQVTFTSAIGFFLALVLGFGAVAAIYIAIALTFSSTIIIVKLLSDKREIDSLHGRIAVGFLIVQDIVVVITLIAISAFNGTEGGTALSDIALVFAQGLGLLVAVGLLMRFVIPRVMPIVARSQELLVLLSIAWAVALAVTADFLGLSQEVGAFLAGVSLASTPFRESIGGRLTTVRDFLLLFFFVDLGSNLDFAGVSEQLLPAGILSLFVLVGNPLIVLAIMGLMGYRRRTGFLAGLAVAQISEFSLIFAALGVTVGHIDEEVLGLVTMVGLVTIGVSTYMILYSHQLFERLSPWLGIFERRTSHPEDKLGEMGASADVVLFGVGRYGSAIAAGLRERGRVVLGIDFDPEAVRLWQDQDLPVHYGDAGDPELLQVLPLPEVSYVICAAPDLETNLALLRGLRHEGYAGRIALTARSEEDAAHLAESGADLVFRPFSDAAVRAVEEIIDSGSTSNLNRLD